MDAIATIRQNLEAFRTASPRERRSFAKAAAYHAANAEKAGLTTAPDALALMITALELGARHHGWPAAWQAARLRLMKRSRALSGAPEPVTVAEARGTLECTGGFIVAHGAGSLDDALLAPGTPAYCAAREAGAFYDVATGGDGAFRVVARVLSTPEPDVSTAELARVVAASPTGLVRATGNAVRLWAGGEAALTLPVPDGAGDLIAAWFLMKGRGDPAILFVASPAEGRRPACAEAAFEV